MAAGRSPVAAGAAACTADPARERRPPGFAAPRLPAEARGSLKHRFGLSRGPGMGLAPRYHDTEACTGPAGAGLLITVSQSIA